MVVSQASAFESDVGPVRAILVLDAGDDVLQKRLEKRGNFDDTGDSIAKRIQTYNAKTVPVVEQYADKVSAV